MIEAKRLPGWRARLALAMAHNERQPFAWGTNDCFLGLVVPVVEAITGQDIGVRYRGSYDSESTGLEAMASFGYADMADLVSRYLPEIPPAKATVGDVAVITIEGGPFGGVLGVVIGERIVTMDANGRATVRLAHAARAFKVG